MSSPSLLVFGPQTSWPTEDYLSQLRDMLISEPRLKELVSAIRSLPQLWDELASQNTQLNTLNGADSLQRLTKWIDDDGSLQHDGAVAPNILSMPLTIIIHLAQYIHYLDNNTQGLTHSQVLNCVKSGGVQGFCVGLLSAITVASSQTEQDLSSSAGIAVRLATCIGAYIDMDCLELDTDVLAVRYLFSGSHPKINSILKNYKQSFISAIRDSTDLNVTVPCKYVEQLSQDLTAENMKVKSIGLKGRCHSNANSLGLKNIEALATKCDNLWFSEEKSPFAPVYSNKDGQILKSGSINKKILTDILIDISDWHKVMVLASSPYLKSSSPLAISFGLIDSIPSSILRESGLNVEKWKTAILSDKLNGSSDSETVSYPDNAIAIVGMACRFPGADNLEEFWDILAKGSSMCKEMPSERFSTKDLRRTPDGKLKFYGCFINDADAFDHKFFKKSSREAASMDPQQRILLEVAYAAMEDAGYFGGLKDVPKDIGVYLGSCAGDYNDNVASHPPTAFSSLGTLRAFLSGRISHWFDWTGPSVVYDTACSSSAVAIDAACKAILVGDCSQAVAGGVSLYTNPNFYQNLAAASFLSPTGPTKPWDSKADGYCRGEGIGLVVLKKLSAAIADNDNIISVISGSSVNQNQNCTYITVPHGGSQQNLYSKVVDQAHINPSDVTYVEAHGTGTPVGDPIEFESVCKIFANEKRDVPLNIASVKGNIGHLEGAAGVASLIKVCLMMQKQAIPLQANYSTMNPKIVEMGFKDAVVPTSLKPWDANFRIACVNNYGAAGSNAAMIIADKPAQSIKAEHEPLSRYPVYFSAGSKTALASYATALLKQITAEETGSKANLLANVAFNLANKQNRDFPHVFSTTATNLTQFSELLQGVASDKSQFVTEVYPAEKKPVVLCFGGQVSDFVGLDKRVFESSALLKYHLDSCDVILQASGLPSLYPGIFQTESVKDVVHLHGMLFSLQYASALAWVDSGLKVDSLVGHSFGQLTALTVAGCLSLADGIKLVTGRAELMKTRWGTESGSMISIEADSSAIDKIVSTLKSNGKTVEVACFNGPTSHVLVGDTGAIDAVQDSLSTSGHKYRRLQVTHGFHSRFTEPLLPELYKLAESLNLTSPTIPIETCSDKQSWEVPTPQSIVDHTRTAVYFGQAVQRLANRLGPSTWIEAGSASSITGMVRRGLSGNTVNDTFLPISLRQADGLGSLADTAALLWKNGYFVQFWPFNRMQRAEYDNINLPPYQFEKSKHWLEWIDTVQEKIVEKEAPLAVVQAPVLLTFSRYNDKFSKDAEFIVDPRSDEYAYYVKGHAVLAEPLCPAPLYCEIVTRAATTLDPADAGSFPAIENLNIHAPLGLDPERAVTLSMKQASDKPVWNFEFTSKSRSTMDGKQTHATGTFKFEGSSQAIQNEFAHYERLVSYEKFSELKDDLETDAMQGSMIYKVFEKVVNYDSYYKGVRAVYSKKKQVGGLVSLPKSDVLGLESTLTNPLAVDNFFQVAGLHVNSLNDVEPGEVAVCTKVDGIRVSPEFQASESDSWVLYSTFSETGNRELVNDVFVFDINTRKLVLIGLGARFTRVKIPSLSRVLAKANKGIKETEDGAAVAAKSRNNSVVENSPAVAREPDSSRSSSRKAKKEKVKKQRKVKSKAPKQIPDSSAFVFSEVQKCLSKVAEIDESDVKGDSTLDDLGIDSLMIMEVLSEVQTWFKVEIPNDVWQTLATPQLLSNYLVSVGAGGSEAPVEPSEDSSESESASEFSDLSEYDSSVSSVSSMDSVDEKFIESGAPVSPPPVADGPAEFENAQQAFEDTRYDYDKYTVKTGFDNFWKKTYPLQSQLVLAYTVEAFAKLNVDLKTMKSGDAIPKIEYLPKHELLVKQLYVILEDGGLTHHIGGDKYVRSEKAVDTTPSTSILEKVNQEQPQHQDEHNLLHITGSKLGECLIGTEDPIRLLFVNRENKALLERVYQLGPMYEAITEQLAEFLRKAMQNPSKDGYFHILELGGGTAGTAKFVTKYLMENGIKFKYTFTDISAGLVNAAKRTFKDRDNMEYTTIDIEKEPPEQHKNKYHVILSTNCIHATKNLQVSTNNMRKMLRPEGFMSVVEFTRNMFWFDLVFGLLDGWWFFQDGRKHVLADQWFWDRSMRDAGYKHCTWTDGASPEAQTLRIITGFQEEPYTQAVVPKKNVRRKRFRSLTVTWKEVDGLDLLADIYLPSDEQIDEKPRSPALMFHGGGHVLYGRKDFDSRQLENMIDEGLLPIGFDYRLAPEVPILEGSMSDAADAVEWARTTLPTLPSLPVRINSAKVTVVGWSTGGHLALTTAFHTKAKGYEPPAAILAFYCPSNWEAPWWQRPIYPRAAAEAADTPYDLLEGVADGPVAGYFPPVNKGAGGMAMTVRDARWRFVLHANWKVQWLPMMLQGLPTKARAAEMGQAESSFYDRDVPTAERVQSISPFAQVQGGAYSTPTYMIHGTDDDLIPWQQSEDLINALNEKGTGSCFSKLDGVVHCFDLFNDSGRDEIRKAYKWLASHC